jgi:hypothetical protein
MTRPPTTLIVLSALRLGEVPSGQEIPCGWSGHPPLLCCFRPSFRLALGAHESPRLLGVDSSDSRL